MQNADPPSLFTTLSNLFFFFKFVLFLFGAHVRPTRPGKVKAKSKSSWDGAPIMRAKPEKGGIGNCSAPFLLSTCFVRLSDPEIQPAPPSSPCLFIKNEYFYSEYRGHRSLSHVHETPRPGFVMYFASFMDTTHFGGSKSAKQCLPRLSGRRGASS